ncbi:D-alanine--D-alanine ligase family protein [Bifidobacterium psychraerophilum]|jgi:D-alanine-D-alanine ligase|uniref:D-alanine--D-alanine ligase family protein n=1 Tax=Bifidobacterium psychraerophilum TaxID=218140 RepID=UPI0023F167B2|nr:D-alanine--D-alanine ligase family protein [Bifidobacterium psychraerophilum]MCI1659863.1 D-alanine--D-alanine ligase [Bifidobacterium psychraerophilum]MCI1805204.1 D-alanine--D-alanine ligase [Bifidobacterium psychraerophilum]MCI2177270.1 D-alanine--D-alanine ligase [Bifidobacterium psychraerophilum]MCI2182421.1 D-alanine--D-alanine ligase [Bifidobacterium psychraerophilum]
MPKKRIVVLYGGRADEHPISCISAAGVLRAIDTERFDVVTIGITRSGQWIIDGEDPRAWNLDDGSLPSVEITPSSRPVLLDVSRGADGFVIGDHDELKDPAKGYGTNFVSMADSSDHGVVTPLGHIDGVFPVLHGPYGEDGTLQGLLDMMDVPYVGCGVFASAACMDKHFTKVLLQASGIGVAPWITVDARTIPDDEDARIEAGKRILARIEDAHLQYPLFIKPSRAGSSFGVTKVEHAGDSKELIGAILEAAGHDWKVLVEEGVSGREIECAVLRPSDRDEVATSWPGEVVLDNRGQNDEAFYDFDSKYMDAEASHVEVPAKLPEETLQKVRDMAAKAFAAVDGRGLSRVDTFVSEDGSVMVNEINTMPGFTPISMYSKAWEATGIGYTELITTLIDGALR